MHWASHKQIALIFFKHINKAMFKLYCLYIWYVIVTAKPMLIEFKVITLIANMPIRVCD